ncbi:hypothetical protein ACX16Y_12085 [Bacillus cereus]|uniref:hypothetical protein n=1 Tax=Bacillus TaxID=1386 RepID=UPI00122EAEC0|nr:hypothetical protein [Bacillus cereus]KAA2398113.1 hypothetical protein F2Y18_12185 [Bacillus cereus]MDH8002808.1 hypothetical protein [Bacillus cereus]
MLDFINFLAILWLSICLLVSIVYVLKHQAKTIHIVYVVFYVLFVVPLILDYLVGQPEYRTRPGFYLASRDEITSYIYAFYISIVPLIWCIFSKSQNKYLNLEFHFDINILKKLKPFLILLVISPFLGWMFSPNPMEYLTYAAASKKVLSEDSLGFHVFLSRLCLLSVITIFILLISKKRLKFIDFIMISPWLLTSIWLHGKRSIVMMVVVLLCYLVWQKKLIKGIKLAIFGSLMIVLFLSFSNTYQKNLRFTDFNVVNKDILYENIRIDYGRDDVTKLAIYAELYPNQVKILEYRFQSAVFYATAYIPREWWPDKPYPYDNYVTSATWLTGPQLWSSNMTTSLLEEAIANSGWIGMLVAPLMLSIFCRIGDESKDILIRLVTLLVACLSLALHFMSYYIFFIVWVVMILINKRKRKRAMTNHAI